MGKPKPKEQEQAQPSQMQTWDSSSYLARKAKRQESIVPQWIQNPETKERFLVRRQSMMPTLIAENMAKVLKEESLAAWVERGLELPEVDTDGDAKERAIVTAEIKAQRQVHNRLAQISGKTVVAACIVPRIVLGPAKAGELDILDLDPSDLNFIHRYALGLEDAAPIEMQGGDTVPVEDMKRVSGEPRRRFGTIGRG